MTVDLARAAGLLAGPVDATLNQRAGPADEEGVIELSRPADARALRTGGFGA